VLVGKHIGDAINRLQPDQAVIDSVRATDEWLRQHGGRL
jgi:hypothetical protein